MVALRAAGGKPKDPGEPIRPLVRRTGNGHGYNDVSRSLPVPNRTLIAICHNVDAGVDADRREWDTSRRYGGAVEQVQMKEDLTALRQRVVSELAAIDVVVWPRRKRTRRERLTRFLAHRARKARRMIL
jgi:hypothetical protein